jgi:hypothetical protein
MKRSSLSVGLRSPCGSTPGTSELHYPNHLRIDIAASPRQDRHGQDCPGEDGDNIGPWRMDLVMSGPLVMKIQNGATSGYLVWDAILIEKQ